MGNKQTVFTKVTDQASLIIVVKTERERLETVLNTHISKAKEDFSTVLSDPNSIREIKKKMKLREEKLILRSFIEGIKKAEKRLAEKQFTNIPKIAERLDKIFEMSSQKCTDIEVKVALYSLEEYLGFYKNDIN